MANFEHTSIKNMNKSTQQDFFRVLRKLKMALSKNSMFSIPKLLDSHLKSKNLAKYLSHLEKRGKFLYLYKPSKLNGSILETLKTSKIAREILLDKYLKPNLYTSGNGGKHYLIIKTNVFLDTLRNLLITIIIIEYISYRPEAPSIPIVELQNEVQALVFGTIFASVSFIIIGGMINSLQPNHFSIPEIIFEPPIVARDAVLRHQLALPGPLTWQQTLDLANHYERMRDGDPIGTEGLIYLDDMARLINPF